MGKHVAIIGNIGAGKTTTMEALAANLSANTYPEGVDDNPFLELFYQNPTRWSFASAHSFLRTSWLQQLTIRSIAHPEIGIQDRTVYDQLDVFLGARIRNGIMQQVEFDYLQMLAADALGDLPGSDLYIYSRVLPDELLKRIKLRGREYEAGITAGLLGVFHEGYEDFIKRDDVKDKLLILDDDFDARRIKDMDDLTSTCKEFLQ